MSDKLKALRGRRRVTTPVGARSRTHQSFKDECDVNNIMARYAKTGVLDHVRRSAPVYGDFVEVADYHTALNVMIEAQDMFDALPAKVRRRFNNDPAELMEFVHDPENSDEAHKLGLLKPDFKPPVAADVAPESPEPVVPAKPAPAAPAAAQAPSGAPDQSST